MIGKPKPALTIKHDIVRTLQRVAVAFGVEHVDFATRKVDSLDSSAAIIVWLVSWKNQTVSLMPLKATVITDIAGTVRPYCCTIGSASRCCYDLDATFRGYAADSAPLDFDHNNTAVGHSDWTFGKLQASGDFCYLVHVFFFRLFWVWYQRYGQRYVRNTI